MDSLKLFKLDPESIAEGESWKVGSDGGSRERNLGDILGDGALSILTGKNYREEVDKATKDRYVSKVEDKLGKTNINKYSSVPGGEQLGSLADTSVSTLEATLTGNKELRNSLDQAMVLTGRGEDAFAGLSTPGAILATAQKIKRGDEEDREDEIRGEQIAEKDKDRKALEAYQSQVLAGQKETRDFNQWQAQENNRFRQHQLEVEGIRLENARAERVAEKNANREDKRYALEMQIAQNGLDRAYQRERDERADARADKAQRQQSIMALVKGLSQLGAGFSL